MMRRRAREEDDEVMADAQPKRITYQNQNHSQPRTLTPPSAVEGGVGRSGDSGGGGGDASGVAGQLKAMGFSENAVMIAIMQVTRYKRNFRDCHSVLCEARAIWPYMHQTRL